MRMLIKCFSEVSPGNHSNYTEVPSADTVAVSESRRPRIESDTVIEKETNVRAVDPSRISNPNFNFTLATRVLRTYYQCTLAIPVFQIFISMANRNSKVISETITNTKKFQTIEYIRRSKQLFEKKFTN